MKKLILLSILLIVGCKNATAPAPEDCTYDTLSNALVGSWAGSIKLDTNYWGGTEIPDSVLYFLMTVDSNNMVHVEGYKCDGYDCNRIDGGGEESFEMITIEYHDTTYLINPDFDDVTPTFNLSHGFAYELEGHLLTIIDLGLIPVSQFTVERCEAEGSNSYCYFGCTDESNINFDSSAIYDDASCLYGVTGKIVDQAGEPIKDAAILLTYDLNDFIGREVSGVNMPTTINLNISTETHVFLWIEDMCDDTMAVLVDEVLPAGYHQIIWDATGVLEGIYKVHMVTSEFQQSQNRLLALLFYSDLEMIDGELMQTLQDTSYTHDYHAMTDVDGNFSIPFDCLSFGIEQIGVDENGNFTDNWTIPYRTKLWIVHEGNAMFSTQTYAVDPDNDLYVEITTPY